MKPNEFTEQQILQMAQVAIAEGQFVPYYQPQINIMTGAVSGSEALARWLHPEYGIITPGTFIPILEKTGHIYDLDKYMWRTVCRDIRRWRDAGISLPPISVNISRWDIVQPDLANTLLETLAEYDLTPQDLYLEITESAYLQDPEALLLLMQELRKHGFFIEMDDFGSGYSSLTALKDLPFDLIKLDAGLLRESDEVGKTGTILAGIIRLLRQLDIPMIAEGVEDSRQADYLKSTGCYLIQGYLFSKPLPGADYIAFLKHHNIREYQAETAARESAEVNFLDYRTQEDLLFNKYVGAACILELQNNHITMLRANDRLFSGLNIPRTTHITGDFAADILDSASLPLLHAAMENAIRTGNDQGCELQACGRWLQVRVHLLSKQTGSALFYCDGIDNTESKLLRQSLDSAEKLYHSVIEEAESAILVSDAITEDILFANRSACSFFHTAKEELLRMKYTDCPQLSDVRLSDELEKDGDLYDTHFKHDGQSIHLRSVFAHWNERPAVISYLWDNTKLVAFSDRMKGVLSNLPSGVSIYELQDGIFTRVFMSDVGAKILDYTPDEDAVNGFQIEIERMLPEDREKSAAAFAAIPKTMEPGEYEFRIRCRDGSIRWISFRYRPTFNANSGKWELYTVYSDVTTARVAEETVRLNEQKYRIAALQTNKMICTYIPEERALVVSDEMSKEFDSVSYLKNAPEEFIRQNYIAEESREAWLGLFAAIERGDKTGTVPELGIATLTTGEILWYSAAFTAIQNEDGKTVSVVLAFDNITEARKQKHEQSGLLTKFQTLLSLVGGNSLDLLMILNPSEGFYEVFTNGIQQSHITRREDSFNHSVRRSAETMVIPEEREQYLHDAMLETVLAHLEKDGFYRYSYTRIDGRREAEFHWLNDSHKEIIMIVRNVQQLFEAEQNFASEHDKVSLINQAFNSGLWTMEFDRNGKIRSVFWSDEFRQLLGFTNTADFPNTLEAWSDRLHPEDAAATLVCFWSCIEDTSGQTPYDVEFRLINKAGKYRWFHANGRVSRTAVGQPLLMAGTFVDISDEKAQFTQQLDEERRIRETLTLAGLGTCYLEHTPGAPNRLYLDTAAKQLFSLFSAVTPELCYRQWFERVDPKYKNAVRSNFDALARGEHPELVYSWKHPTQGNIFIRFNGYLDDSYTDRGYRICGYLQIVSESVNREMELTSKLKDALDSFKQADYDKRRDYLTGLYNRMDMYELLHDPMSALRERITAMYMMDIDNFKLLNDHYGHRRGDECLRAIGQALTHFAAANNMRFYRYGGEELLGICFGSDQDPRFVASSLLRLIYDLNITRDDMPLGRVTVSIGYSTGHGDYDRMLDQADTAMYQAKAAGKNRFVRYESNPET